MGEAVPTFTIHRQPDDDALEHVAFSLDQEDWYDLESYQSDPLELLIAQEQHDEQNQDYS